MYKNKFFQTIKNILIIMLFFWLREKGCVNNWGFVLGAIGTILIITIISQRLKIKSTMKNLDRLKSISKLIATDPNKYFLELDTLIEKSSGYEKDYMILHKANTLAKINRASEAIDILMHHHPRYLDTNNQGVYYNNLLGLLVQENRISDAKKVYEEFKDILESNLNNNFAYSIHTNIANLKYHLNQKADAIKHLNQAIESTDNQNIIKNIQALKNKMQK